MARKDNRLEHIFSSTLSITGGERSALRSMNADVDAIGKEIGGSAEDVRRWVKKRRAEL